MALQPHGSSPNFSRAFQFFQCRRFAPALKKLKSATEIRFAAYNPLKAYTQLVLFKGVVLTKTAIFLKNRVPGPPGGREPAGSTQKLRISYIFGRSEVWEKLFYDIFFLDFQRAAAAFSGEN